MSTEHKGWIGVDFDGTLAHYDGWKGNDHLGEPVPLMQARVTYWLTNGEDVRIFTARVGRGAGYSEESKASDTADFAAHQEKLIRAWCLKHLGRELPVTATKDFRMRELWDDRAVQVIPNQGVAVDGRSW